MADFISISKILDEWTLKIAPINPLQADKNYNIKLAVQFDNFPSMKYESSTTFEVKIIPDPCLKADLFIDAAIYDPAPFEYVLE